MLGNGKDKNFVNDSWVFGLDGSVEWTAEPLTGRRAGLGTGCQK